VSKSLETAISHLLSMSPQSPRRLELLADYLKYLIEKQGLPGVQGGSTRELAVVGLARKKNWDIAYEFAGKFRLLVSLKSMLKNVAGSVPNRLDDLQGELANVQQLFQELVIGYVILFDVAKDTVRQDKQGMWSEFFEAAIKSISIRRAPLWNQGLLESSWFVRFDSRKPHGQRLINPRKIVVERNRFIMDLLCELHRREPAVQFTKPLNCEPLPRRTIAAEIG
jgi:hypothetical protein